MKRIVVLFSVIFMIAALSSCGPSRPVVVERPVEPVYVRPVAPGANYVWVNGDWRYVGGRYVYSNGYWAAPRVGRVYTPGVWINTRRGYYWRRGRWH